MINFVINFFFYIFSSINTEPKYTINVFEEDNPKILLMPIDIEICELTLAGMCEPKASWTTTSKENIILSFKEFLSKRNASLNDYNKQNESEDLIQIIKLHTQMGQEIINNEYGALKLPTKEEFNWSLGKKIKLLKNEYETDYAIFIFFRDQYSSTERVIYNIVTAVLFPGIIPVGGSQLAFASLVDLRDGKITWFNGYYRSFGDVRNLEDAKNTIDKLFEKFPG